MSWTLPIPAWVADSACGPYPDPEVFFRAGRGEALAIATAKQLCADCPVRTACLEYALTHNEEYGVWGGLTEGERFRLTRRYPRRFPTAS